MRHPFDGIVGSAAETGRTSESAEAPAKVETRRSLLRKLFAAALGVFGFGVAAKAVAQEERRYTTLAVGEEGGSTPSPAPPTTLRRGEEGGQPSPTTRALGEEGTDPRPTTRARDEEGGGQPTTLAVGEEGGPRPTTRALNEEGGPRPTTLAVGEEGGRQPSTLAAREGGGPTPNPRRPPTRTPRDERRP